MGADGTIYGVTSIGGAYGYPTNTTYRPGNYGYGTIFKMNPQLQESVLLSFDTTNGAIPSGGLVLASDNNLYGTTEACGQYGFGTLFKCTTNGILTVLHQFGDGPTDGTNSVGEFVQAPDGCLYGVCPGGGLGAGTMFRLPLNSGPYTNVYFYNPNAEGAPAGGLILGKDGNLYGATGGGGTNLATVYSITTNGAFHVIATFTNFFERPYGRLLQADDGNFYGTAWGGVNGNIFKVTPGGTVTIFPYPYYDSESGINAGLVQANDGNLYGTTDSGGGGKCWSGIPTDVDRKVFLRCL